MLDASEPKPGDGLPPARLGSLLEDYFARLRSAARRMRIDIDEDTLAELLAHVEHRLDGSDRSDVAVRRILAELGEPEALAHAYAADDRADDRDDEFGLGVGFGVDRDLDSGLGHDETTDADARDHRNLTAGGVPRSHRAGTVLGIPYDTRQPTSERFATTAWNPADRRILVPKVLGIGWTLNFGALAVRAHLVRPDDEDVPFAEAAHRLITATLLAPVLVGAVFAAVAAATWAGLPETVPSHWGITGEPDGYSSRTANLLILTGFIVVPLLAAVWVHLARRPAWNRVAASAVSLALALVALACLVQTVYAVHGGAGVWPTLIGFCLMLALPLGLLVLVSRSGRAAEQRRDFALSSKKGTAQ